MYCASANGTYTRPMQVQDPFTFAVEGTDALVVGQKLGFVIGMILICHALLAFFEAPASSNDQRTTQPVGRSNSP